MKVFSMNLSGYSDAAIPQAQPVLEGYILDKERETPPAPPKPAVVILPGSGYHQCCPREGEPVAMEFLKSGIQSFVLYYRCQTVYPAPLLDAAEALNIIRDHAEEWNIDKDKIVILGFSAGGHLAALLSTCWNEPVIAEHGLSNAKARPNGSILCYPVITSEPEKCHEGSFTWLLGEKKQEMREAMSLEKRVNADTPPAFIWHTASDPAVPVISSLRYCEALTNLKIPAEMHIFPQGTHGTALCRKTFGADRPELIIPEAQIWIDLAIDWMKRNFM